MKVSKNSILGILLLALMFASCEYDGIDPITQVDPGPDAGAPTVNIQYPSEGTTLKVVEPVTQINIKFEVVDDIEVQEVVVKIDGSQIASFDEFTDYRIVKKEVNFDEVTTGEHVLEVSATDVSGNTTSQSVHFSKEPPYTPRFANEFFYMPFDGDYTELMTITNATEVGEPGFSSDAYLGTKSYLGAADSYLTIPFDGAVGESFTAAFWYKVSGTPDRAGILVAGANAEDRNQGFRLFREGSATEQRIKLNVGTGSGESWNDGGVIDVTEGEWVHVAFTVTPSETTIYLNGNPVNTADMSAPIDWSGVENLTIGAGGETFSYWDHLSDNSPMDELRIFDAALSQEQIQALINASAESLYMPFNGEFKDVIANREITVVGNPAFASESIEGSAAYNGATGSYLTMPAEGLKSEEFSATFWYKLNPDPDRAGLLTASAEDLENAGYPDTQNLRNFGFRLFREGNAEEQRIKLNVGTGDADSWNDGGVIQAGSDQWVFVAFTISNSETKIYLDGELVNTATLAKPMDWTGVDLFSVMSGAPRFTEWGHLSDTSNMDALRFYNKSLTQQDIQAAMQQ